MSLKLLHTADVHLGMKFASYGERQEELCDARFKTLESVVGIANRERCQLLVVGGDLFDRIGMLKRDVVRAAGILSQFEGALTVVLPGNHDYLESSAGDALWSSFKEASGDRMILLEEARVYDLARYDLEGVHLYPGPCRAKKSENGNAIGWVKDQPKDPSARHHIGIAHGSMEGLSFDREGRYYPMTEAELLQAGVDFWLMGHIHVQHPPGPDPSARIYYPGTPEPDGFDCKHEGKAWLIELGDDGSRVARSLSTGTYRFEHEELELSTLEQLRALGGRFEGVPARYQKTLLKLRLRGRLGREEYQELAGEIDKLSPGLFHLKAYAEGVGIRVTDADISREFSADSFPHQLLTELARGAGDSEALQIAYDLIRGGGAA